MFGDKPKSRDPSVSKTPVRSKPLYRKRLAISTILFASLILADIAVVGFLVFRYLSERTVAEALESTREGASRLARKLEEKIPEDGIVLDPDGPADIFQVRELNRVFDTYVDDELAERRIVSHVVVKDVSGNIVYQTRSLRGKRFVLRPRPRVPGEDPEISPDFRRGELTLGSRNERIYEIVVPVSAGDGARGGTLHMLVPESNLNERVAGIRQSLVAHVLVGAGLSLLFLLVAFFYVLRLLNRTRQLEAEAQMADRLAYVGTLAGGLAHEIRNPLNAMNINVQMIQEEIADLPTDEQRRDEYSEMLDGIGREIKRLAGLVTDFLAYASPQRLQLENTDPHDLVDEVVRVLEAEFKAKGITLEKVPGERLRGLRVDRSQVKQALINVLLNAADAVEKGAGQVQVAVSGSEDGHSVTFSIADNGSGIPPREMENIFRVFHSTKKGGTGLGLAISRRIVESHGGSIGVRTRPDGGALFELTLPAAG